jgi:WD40 repeat protein
VIFLRDGRWLATVACAVEEKAGVCAESEIVLWDAATWKVTQRLSPHMRSVNRLAVTSDGGFLVMMGRRAGGRGQQLHSLLIWDTGAQEPAGEISLSEDEFWCSDLAMTSSRAVVAGAPCDANDDFQVKEIRLWEVPSAELVATVTIPPERYLQLAFSPDGETLAALGFEQGILSLWGAVD